MKYDFINASDDIILHIQYALMELITDVQNSDDIMSYSVCPKEVV